MTLDEAIKSLMALQAKLAAYGHAMGLLFYDGATTAPKGTAANRGQTMSILSEEHYKLTTGGETVALLEFLDAHKSELNEKQQRMVFLLIKDIRNMQKIPMDEYVAYQQLLVEADDVWHRAKETSDFALFEPVLEKIFETNIRFAHYCASEKDPYDYWLSEYEDGLTMAQCDEFFATLREHIVPLLKKIKEKPQVDDAMLHGHFPEEKQAQLSDYLMRTMGLDLDHVGLSTTEHPFTTSLGSHFDERITTHYLEENFASSMFSVIHEGGHALYELHTGDELENVSQSFDKMADAVQEKIADLQVDVQRREDFMGAFAHELKTPMTSIIGYADMLRTLQIDPAEQHEAAGAIYHESRRLEALSYKLLSLLSLSDERLELAPVDLTDLWPRLRMACPQVPLLTPQGGAVVHGDADLLLGLLCGLVQTAAKASPAGMPVTVLLADAGDTVALTVQDHGCGIPADKLARVTEPFYMVDKSRARKQGGSGMGLALCQRIAAVHGGTLQISSQVGVGTAVTVTLPKEVQP